MTVTIKDLSLSRELDRKAMPAVVGGFWFLTGCIEPLPTEMEMGEECNNGICVPYQDEDGNY